MSNSEDSTYLNECDNQEFTKERNQNPQFDDQEQQNEKILNKLLAADQEFQYLNAKMNDQSYEDYHLLDYKQDFDLCEQQIFEKDFQNSHFEACILISNCINQNTKPNIKAILSKDDKFILRTEIQNDTKQYVQKYKSNLIKIVNNFIQQNTPEIKLSGILIELENQIDNDICDNIFNNINELKRKIKGLNKLM